MNWTEEQLAGHYSQHGLAMPKAGGVQNEVKVSTHRKQTGTKLKPIEGPLDVKLVLWGHCPSKKSNYRVSASGRLISDTETKEQMEALTLQAMFQWSAVASGPVEHPDVTTTFFVAAKRQDEDGMYVTLMDVIQKAGVIVNDNIAHFNGRKIHESCQFVDAADERVEITVRKSA